MADQLFRVTGVATFHLSQRATDEDAARGVVDLREWRRRYGNDAELGTAYNIDTAPGEARGESLDFHLRVNDVEAPTVTGALTRGLLLLRERLEAIGRRADDAQFFAVDATRQRRRASERDRV